MASTYSEYIEENSSEKVGFAIVSPAKKLVGWSLYSGSIYSCAFDNSDVVESVKVSGTAYTLATTIAGVTAGKYYFDKDTDTIYLRMSDSSDPSNAYIICFFQLFFANIPLNIPYDLSTGFEVHFQPLILAEQTRFNIGADNINQPGATIDGSGKIVLINDFDYFSSQLNEISLDNKFIKYYSWNRNLTISSAKLIFRGKIESVSISDRTISLEVKDINQLLNNPLISDNLEDAVYNPDTLPCSVYPDLVSIPNADVDTYSSDLPVRITEAQRRAKQRVVYGYAKGVIPAPIDQILDGYPMDTSTITATNGSATITRSSGSTAEIWRDDVIFAYLIDLDELLATGQTFYYKTREYTVKTPGATTIVLNEPWEDYSVSTTEFFIKPSQAPEYGRFNRHFLLAGHPLAKPSSTITSIPSAYLIEVADATKFLAGDLIECGTDYATITDISDNYLGLNPPFNALPSIGATVYKASVQAVYLHDKKLTPFTDYTYDASTAILSLENDAEINNGDYSYLGGTSAFTSASVDVIGTGTAYTKQLSPGDRIFPTGGSTAKTVWYIDTDLALSMNATAGLTASGATSCIKVKYYKERESVLSVDMLGKSVDGTTSGRLLYRAPEIVKDILTDAGLSSYLDTASFDDNNDIVYQKIGVAFPKKYTDTKIQTAREAINEINQSVLCLIHTTDDSLIKFSVLGPERSSSDTVFTHNDVLSVKTATENKKVFNSLKLRYRKKEYDYLSEKESFLEYLTESNDANYLSESVKEKIIDTLLVDEEDARVMSNRYAAIYGVSTQVTTFNCKLRAHNLSLFDRIRLDYPKFPLRNPVGLNTKLGLITGIDRSAIDNSIEFSDPGNIFRRCGLIVDSTSSYDELSGEEILYMGFISEDDGLLDNDPDTADFNLIW